MLNWIKQALGGAGAASNGKYGPHILEPLRRDLGRLGESDASLPAKALEFVLEGSGGDIPGLIRKSANAHRTWSHLDQDQQQRQVRWRLYDHWDELPGELWIRFGSVLAAHSPILANATLLMVAQQHPWIEALALDLAGFPLSHYGVRAANCKSHPQASLARLETLLESVGRPRSTIVTEVFQSRALKHFFLAQSPDFITALPDYQASVVRDADLVRGAFRNESFETRRHVLTLIEKFDAPGLQPFAAELVALALDSSSKVRAAAIPLALRAGDAVLEIARQEAVAQKPEARARALELLWDSQNERARSFVRERALADSAESVRVAAKARMERVGVDKTVATTEVTVPELKLDFEAPVSHEALEQLRHVFLLHNAYIRKQREAARKELKQHWQELSGEAIGQILAQTANHPRDGKLQPAQVRPLYACTAAMKALNKWADRGDVSLVHLVRLLIAIRSISIDPAWQHPNAMDHQAVDVLSRFGRTPGRASLLALEQIFAAYGVPVTAIVHSWFMRWSQVFAASWPSHAVWPFFARHVEVLSEALNPASALRREFWYSPEPVFAALESFPEPPAAFVPQLFDLAFGTAKADRAAAQRVLDRYPHKIPRIIDALRSGKAETRAAAAAWLGRLRAPGTVEPLEAALDKEKHDLAAGAMMSALQALGVPVERFLNRAGLLRDAQAGLKKGVPADLQWFPFEGLPGLEWNDTGEAVPDEIRRWWIIQSFKLKTPEPSGVLRQYFAALRPADRAAFALYVLQAWLREDVKPISVAEAEKLARTQAQQIVAVIKRWPQGYSDAHKAMTEDQFYEVYLPGCLARPAGSATASKGVLAVVAAGGGADIAPVVQRYIKQWYGTRPSQGKALIQMLAWVDHPTATQLMLSIGSRFRTKSFQEEATRQAQLLAERHNWSLDELADRTIPTAGFDSDGTALIDYGERQFTAKLGADFEIELFSPEGKPISSLPDARKDEDEARVKEAKKQWSTARKELKGVLQLQKERLYEGLCTQRTWAFEDWDTYLNRHPIVRRYCQRLVWGATGKAGERRTFRPLDDGSLTDLDDNVVELEPTAMVFLAHDSNVPESEAQGWQRHLKDYKIDPLFQQFGKETYHLAEDHKEATEVEDFKGHLIEAFKLRGRANKLGYTRGAAEDGGWFTRYEKRFPTLGLEVHIEFTGNSLPEENRPVALLALAIVRRGQSALEAVKLPLGEVPKVLLGECWNDMRTMAADGFGFDPDWQKTTRY
jgi:hypothetical protein